MTDQVHTFPCRRALPRRPEVAHGEGYEHACFNYLFLAFLLAPLIEQNFAPAMEDLQDAARDIARNRVAAVGWP
jgi:hypothetical protein